MTHDPEYWLRLGLRYSRSIFNMRAIEAEAAGRHAVAAVLRKACERQHRLLAERLMPGYRFSRPLP